MQTIQYFMFPSKSVYHTCIGIPGTFYFCVEGKDETFNLTERLISLDSL
jgi:hypothetical protein